MFDKAYCRIEHVTNGRKEGSLLGTPARHGRLVYGGVCIAIYIAGSEPGRARTHRVCY
jgi:hypothetical protein